MSDNNKLKKLKRIELLELLLEQTEENEILVKENIRLKEENEVLRQKNEDRKISLEKAGTIAEAAFILNGVYDAAEKAAVQYLDSLKELCESQAQKKAQTEEYCNTLVCQAQKRCEAIVEKTKKQCEEMKSKTLRECGAILSRSITTEEV